MYLCINSPEDLSNKNNPQLRNLIISMCSTVLDGKTRLIDTDRLIKDLHCKCHVDGHTRSSFELNQSAKKGNRIIDRNVSGNETHDGWMPGGIDHASKNCMRGPCMLSWVRLRLYKPPLLLPPSLHPRSVEGHIYIHTYIYAPVLMLP